MFIAFVYIIQFKKVASEERPGFAMCAIYQFSSDG
jgi:hypothetical protein